MAEIALLVGLLSLWGLLARDALRAARPARLLLGGRYREARRAAEALERSWMRVLPSVRSSARYAAACALHLEGDLRGALDAVRTIEPRGLSRNMRYAVASLEAATLVLLGEELPRAGELVEGVRSIHHPPEDTLLLAHAKHAEGKIDEAAALVAAAGTRRKGTLVKVGRVLLVEDRRQQEAIFHTLRGLYLIKAGEPDEALADLRIAAASPVTTVYVERARALLPPAGADVDPRSSLAPQVLDEP